MSEDAPRTSTSAPAPSTDVLLQRVRADERAHRPPLNVARRLASVLTGCATLGIGGATVSVLVVALASGDFVGALFNAVILGSMTATFGFLTWRWARDLPPSKQLAQTDQERDALSD